jgi:hypothetical protein
MADEGVPHSIPPGESSSACDEGPDAGSLLLPPGVWAFSLPQRRTTEVSCD